MSPYLPFSARVCLNQHHWLAKRLMSEGIDFKQCSSDGDPLTSCHSTFPQPLQTNIACSAAYLGLDFSTFTAAIALIVIFLCTRNIQACALLAFCFDSRLVELLQVPQLRFERQRSSSSAKEMKEMVSILSI
jgi:hypothetical protein